MMTRNHIIVCLLFAVSLLGATEIIAKQKKGVPRFDHTEKLDVQPLKQAPDGDLSLWFNTPSPNWEEALPIGNFGSPSLFGKGRWHWYTLW